MSLRESWQAEAANWIRLAPRPHPGGDHHWDFNLPSFLDILPPPGRLTVEIGCGEGRVARTLSSLGHLVVGIEQSEELVAAAVEADPPSTYHVADAAALPLESGVADLVVAFMSLQDIDDLRGAVSEAARVLSPDGRFCFVIIHPLRTAGAFAGEGPDAAFTIEDYFHRRPYCAVVERDGTTAELWSEHRPLEDYVAALAGAGFAIETLREPVPDETLVTAGAAISPKWRRVPAVLMVRALLARPAA